MTIIVNVIDFGSAIVNLVVRLIQLAFAVLAWALSLLYYLPALFFLVGLSVVMYFVVTYGNTAVDNVEFAMRCRVEPFYQSYIRPIIDGILRRFTNPLICWWNAFVYYPYGLVREVIFPLLRSCGFLDVVVALGSFLDAVFNDVLINYVATRNFLILDLDFTNICARWQDMWLKWQGLLCCGCNDLCAMFTKLPAIPMFFASDQLRDDQTWCFISNSFNGAMKFLQEVLDVIKEFVYGQLGALPRPTFRAAFDRWCAASTCFWRSWENALQNVWDNFVPYEFVWKDVLCAFDVMTCIMLRTINLLLVMFINGDKVLDHFTNQDSTFWINVVKADFTEIINMWGPSTYFDPIVVALPDTTVMEITSYQLLTTSEARPDGMPNPIFGKHTVTNCTCIMMTRFFCDPTNNGTTCAEKYAGTLLATYDFCCFPTEFIRVFVDWGAWMFEFTLHFQSADNFIVFLDRQPFTTFIKTSAAESFKCLFAVFLVVEQYGECIQTVLFELVLFAFCMAELIFRILVAAVTLPYFELNLPGICNFLTCPGEVPLNMAIGFLDRLVSTGPDTLLNCLCYLLNNGFPVPPAGCTMGCVVGGFISPNATMKAEPLQAKGEYRSKLNPIFSYDQTGKMSAGRVTSWNAQHWWEKISLDRTAHAFKPIAEKLSLRLDQFADDLVRRQTERKRQEQAEKLTTQTPIPPIVCDPPPPCFDLCCLPKALLVLFAQASAFLFRMINAAFQSRNGAGSPYFDGTGCDMGPCFESDATALIVNVIAPLGCLCNFIHLVIPPTGFPDPCCFFTLLGEGLSCTLQVVINVITSLTSDPDYLYIRLPSGFLADFDILLAIANGVFECLCTFIRIVFGLILSQSDLVKNYDPCCIPQKLFRALLETIRLVVRVLISLATLEEESSQCYFYIQSAERPNCVPTLTDLPILVQFDKIRAVLLSPPNAMVLDQCGAQVDPQFQNADEEGIATCICRLINAVLAQVFKPDPNSTAPPGCPIDLCCPIYSVSIFIDQALFFLGRLIASFWQNWEPRSITTGMNIVGPYDIPVEFIEFFFCDEYRGQLIGGPLGSGMDTDAGVINANGLNTDKCGKLEPVLQALKNLLTGCICSPLDRGLGDLADNFLQWFFAFVSDKSNMNLFPIEVFWPKCLCHGGPGGEGIFPPLADLLIVALRQIIIAVRNITNPSYWAPAGGSLTNTSYIGTLSDNLADIDKTWISRFLSPFADAVCKFITNLGCLLTMVLGNTCELERYNVLSSFIHYAGEAIIRLIAIIEAFVKMFAQELPGQCVGNPDEFVGSTGEGAGDTGDGTGADVCAPNGVTTAPLPTGILNADALGSILVALLTFIADALIGIGKLTCTALCPTEVFTFIGGVDVVEPTSTACVCYNKTPYTAKTTDICSFEVCVGFGLTGPNPCGGNSTECTLAEACGLLPNETPSLSNCPNQIAENSMLFPAFLFDGCNGGCRNQTEDVVTSTPVDNGWDQNFQTKDYPWYPVEHPLFPGVGVCHSDIPDGDVAREKFGDGILGPTFQQLCIRSLCVQRGFCKNDQMGPCSPHDPRGVLDGVIISALKYVKCLLNLLFGGIGALIDPLLYILSFLWQLSGGIIRFYVGLLIFIFKLVTRNPFINLISIIPDTLTLLGWFFSIFTQPVVLVAKDQYVDPASNQTYYVNPLEVKQRRNLEMIFYNLFGTNMDGCIENPIPCFCHHFTNITVKCNTDIDTVTFGEMADLLAGMFEGITECDSLVQHAKDMTPTLWTDIPYGERFEYIKCASRHARGMHFHNYSREVWPKDFFYSEDGWYKLFESIKETVVHHVKEAEKYERAFHKTFARSPKVMRQFYRNLDARARIFHNHLITTHGIRRDSPVLRLLIYADHFWHKYNMGYYHYLGGRAWQNIKKGYLPLGTFGQQFREMGQGLSQMARAFDGAQQKMTHSYRATMHGLDSVGKAAADLIYNKGRNLGKNRWSNREELRRHGKEMPALVKMAFNGSLLKSFVPDNIQLNVRKHLVKAGAHVWKHVKEVQVRLKSLGLPLLSAPNWTPLKTRNAEAAQRLFYRVYHTIWPHHTSEKHYNRFILQGNCDLVDGAVNLGARLVDYCVSEFEANLPTNKTMYMARSSAARPGSFAQKYNKRHHWETRRVGGWHRPRIHPKPQSARAPTPRFDRRVYQRAMAPEPGTPGAFNLYDWVVSTLENLFNISLAQPLRDINEDIENWFTNPTIDPADYPNVGFRYWLQFFIRCRFPENLNCSIGIGLEDAIINVTWIFILGFIISALFFPALISLLGIAGGLLIYLIVVFVVAFHYSPACLLMWPSFTTEDGFALPLPIFPISVAATPECFWDEVVAVGDKYITNDYGFLINASLVNGPVAPMCDERISFINCKDVGVSDGIQNILYWLYRAFGPGFCEIVIGIAGTTLGRIIPPLEPYLRQTLTRFKEASPTQMIQQERCGLWTIPSVALPLLILFPFVLFIGFVLPAIIEVLVGVWFLFRASPAFDFIAREGEDGEWTRIEAEDRMVEGDEGQEIEPVGAQIGGRGRAFGDQVARFIRDNFIPGYKVVKQKKE